MTAYWMTRVNVTDSDEYGKYAELAGPAIAKYGGRFLARGGETVSLEGEEYARNVIIRFDSLERAVACYESPEYRKALEHSARSSVRNLCIVEGLE